MREIEEEDAAWHEKARKRDQKSVSTAPAGGGEEVAAETFKAGEGSAESSRPPQARGPRSARDYGFT